MNNLMTNDQCQEQAQSILDNNDHESMQTVAKRIVETWSKEELAAYAVAARMDEYRDGDLSAIENTLMSDLWELEGGA
jgi:UV DNA damage repair endonuclease